MDESKRKIITEGGKVLTGLDGLPLNESFKIITGEEAKLVFSNNKDNGKILDEYAIVQIGEDYGDLRVIGKFAAMVKMFDGKWYYLKDRIGDSIPTWDTEKQAQEYSFQKHDEQLRAKGIKTSKRRGDTLTQG